MRCRGSATPFFLPSLPSDLHCPCPVSVVTYGAETRSGCELLKRRLFPSLHPHSSCVPCSEDFHSRQNSTVVCHYFSGSFFFSRVGFFFL